MFDWISSHPELGKVDVCINNAGLSSAENLREGSMESWRKMLDVNVLALCLCTQLSVNLMTKNNVTDGQIIMISSMSGHRVPPNPSTRFYSASKFAVTGLLEGWRQELRDVGGNIRVCGISPGRKVKGADQKQKRNTCYGTISHSYLFHKGFSWRIFLT